jgi:hypothetical protein
VRGSGLNRRRPTQDPANRPRGSHPPSHHRRVARQAAQPGPPVQDPRRRAHPSAGRLRHLPDEHRWELTGRSRDDHLHRRLRNRDPAAIDETMDRLVACGRTAPIEAGWSRTPPHRLGRRAVRGPDLAGGRHVTDGCHPYHRARRQPVRHRTQIRRQSRGDSARQWQLRRGRDHLRVGRVLTIPTFERHEVQAREQRPSARRRPRLGSPSHNGPPSSASFAIGGTRAPTATGRDGQGAVLLAAAEQRPHPPVPVAASWRSSSAHPQSSSKPP